MTTYYQNKEEYIFDYHKFSSEIPINAKWLIIGTFPTLEKNLEYKFYYSSKTNIFWRVIEEIFAYKFIHHKNEIAILERKDFLKENRIGMTDIIEMCFRKVNSSQDQSIIPIKLRDIFTLLDNFNTIDTIILTSRSGIISSEGLFKTLFLMDNKTLNLKKNENGIRVGEFERGRKIKVLVPYSTSKSYHKDEPKKYDQVKKMYAYCFDKHER
jgi:hypoxanthine-DNA glycosylase